MFYIKCNHGMVCEYTKNMKKVLIACLCNQVSEDNS
jgi:hypothetical protein